MATIPPTPLEAHKSRVHKPSWMVWRREPGQPDAWVFGPFTEYQEAEETARKARSTTPGVVFFVCPHKEAK